MKSKVALFLLAIIFFAFCKVFAYPEIFLPGGGAYDLGDLEEGRIYERSFIIKNSGDANLEVRLAGVSCGCVSIISPKKKTEIAPGSSLEAKFTFNTEGFEGALKKYIYIESNDPKEPQLKLELASRIRRSPPETVKRFISFGFFTIAMAGLIDGINPCAFTVLVFFISFLTFVGYRKKELLVLGVTFILSVFITYMLIGLGLFSFIRSIEAFSFLSKIIYILTATLAIVLGVFSLYDWYIYKKTGNPEEIKLKLPGFIKRRIQKIIQDSSRDKAKTMVELIAAVFLSGFLVSLLESVCTGQTYLPTVTYVLKTPYLRSAAIFYLLLYNLMFIVPLVIIFIAGLAGVKSESFSRFSKKHLGAVKFLTALLFFSLGVLLFIAKGA